MPSFACQERHQRCNIVWLSQPPRWVLLRDGVDDSLTFSLSEQGRVDGTRGNGVHGDTTTTQILSKDSGYLLDSAFRCQVAEGVREDGWEVIEIR